MKKLLLTGVAFTALMAGPAVAADMAVRRPVQMVNNWTGLYVGVIAGAGWSRSETDLAGSPLFCNPAFSGCPPVSPSNTAAVGASAIPPVLGTHPGGALVGGEIGYNYQVGAWVVGAETDLSWTDIDGSSIPAFGAAPFPGFPNDSFAASASADQRLRYFGTVRGRLGYLPTDSLLLFTTGGLAYGKMTSTAALAEPITGPCGFGTCPVTPGAGSVSTTRVGWTIGGGLEYLFADHWTVKAEYLYFNLGSTNYALSPLVSTGAGATFTTVGAVASTTDFSGSILRVGLNYKFGYDVVTK
jgi:outer membrane immunogenic protein